jgi:membrane protein involved in colicin uptake
MLAKFKMSLIEGPAAIEKRQQRQAIAAARAARALQREEARLRQERDRAKQAELAAQAAADAERAAAEQAARDAAEQAERNALLKRTGWRQMSEHHTEISSGPPSPPVAGSAAAERMRAHRKRRQAGLRCLTIELRETELTELIRRKLLEPGARHDPHAIRSAVHRHLDESLGA